MNDSSGLRDRLVGLLEEVHPDPALRIENGTSLIRSGAIDSLGLFRLALWIENETRTRLDLGSLDPSRDWDTVSDILDFVARHRIP
ncbi:MAG: acyl carrier protein [Thermodesulfobacteriota bacterium]